MRKWLSLWLGVLLLLGATTCGGKNTTWQEQYDLGIRYLSEGKYEDAIIAFTAAIEIDPKQSGVYVELARLYIELGDYTNADSVINQGIKLCGKLEKLISLRNEIFRDSQENYSINMPITYSIVYQEGDVIQIESISYEVEKENKKYKNYCSSKTEEGLKRTIYGTLNIDGITWSGGERIYTCYPADSAQNIDVLLAAPLSFSETNQFKQLELKYGKIPAEEFSSGRLRSGTHICAFGRLEDGYQYTIQEMLTTSNYMTIAVYDKSGARTGLLVIELQPSDEVLEMIKKHTILEKIDN